MISQVENIFLCFIGNLCIFGEIYLAVICPFLNWVICGVLLPSCKSSLYILNIINSLSDTWFCKYFSHCGLPFHFVDHCTYVIYLKISKEKDWTDCPGTVNVYRYPYAAYWGVTEQWNTRSWGPWDRIRKMARWEWRQSTSLPRPSLTWGVGCNWKQRKWDVILRWCLWLIIKMFKYFA